MRVAVAAGAAATCSLLYPAFAMAGAFAIMGDNAAAEATRVGGAVLIIILFCLLPHVVRRNFPGLMVAFAAFCVGVFMIATPNKAIGVAENINATVTKGIPSSAGGAGGASTTGGAPARNAGP
jgi:hypothetical protein